VSWFVLTFVILGSTYLLISVAVTIYRQRHAVLLGSPIGASPSAADVESCYDELSDVVDGLKKRLELSNQLLGQYDADEVQRWAEAGGYWLGTWRAVGLRCGFDQRRGLGGSWEEMAVLHDELLETEKSYTKKILSFGKEEAPRMDRLRHRLERIGERLRTQP